MEYPDTAQDRRIVFNAFDTFMDIIVNEKEKNNSTDSQDTTLTLDDLILVYNNNFKCKKNININFNKYKPVSSIFKESSQYLNIRRRLNDFADRIINSIKMHIACFGWCSNLNASVDSFITVIHKIFEKYLKKLYEEYGDNLTLYKIEDFERRHYNKYTSSIKMNIIDTDAIISDRLKNYKLEEGVKDVIMTHYRSNILKIANNIRTFRYGSDENN